MVSFLSNKRQWTIAGLVVLLIVLVGLFPPPNPALTQSDPTITLDPTEGPPGSEVTVTGNGWIPGETVFFVFVVNLEADGTYTDDSIFYDVGEVAVGDDGSFVATIAVPADAKDLGKQIVYAGTAEVSWQTDAEFHVTESTEEPSCPMPTVTLSTSSGKAEDMITIQGKDWLPGGTVAFTMNGPEQYDITSVLVPDSGEWGINLMVVDATPPGDYDLEFSESHEGCELIVTERFTVTVEDETSIVANAGPDQTVPGPSPVNVQFDGSGSTGDIVRYQWYNQWGLLLAEGVTPVIEVNFGHTDPQPGTQRTFTLVVEDSQGNTAQDEVTITLGETTEEEPSCPTPTVTLSVSSGKPGDTIMVQGEGWLPGGTVAIALVDGPLQIDVGSVQVPDSGAWESSFTVPDAPYDYWLAFSESHEECELYVEEIFTIVNPPKNPEVYQHDFPIMKEYTLGPTSKYTFHEFNLEYSDEPEVIWDYLNGGLIVTNNSVRWYVHTERSSPDSYLDAAEIECHRGTHWALDYWPNPGDDVIDSFGCLGDDNDLVDLNESYHMRITRYPGEEGKTPSSWTVEIGDSTGTYHLLAETEFGFSEDGQQQITAVSGTSCADLLELPPLDNAESTCVPADTQPPTASWVKPVGNGEVYVTTSTSGSIELEVTASDNVGVSSVEFGRWDNVNQHWVVISTDFSPPYQASVDVNALSMGWNQFGALAKDASGNILSPLIAIYRQMPNPSITLDPPEGPPGTEVAVEGSGWIPGDTVIIHFASTDREVARGAVGDDGSFVTTFTVPINVAIGEQKVIVGNIYVRWQKDAVFKVKEKLSSQSSVRLDLTEGPAGTKVIATGTNWRAGEYILVTWEDGRQLAEVATVDKRGEFSVEFAVPSDVPPGTYTIYFTAESRHFLPALFRVSDEKPIPRKPFACPMYFLGMHGTNQTADADELKDTLETFKRLALPDTTVERKFVEYNGNVTFPKGDSISELTKLRRDFIDAKNRGVEHLDKEIVSIRNKCVEPKIVLTGYSLGAWAIDYWLIHRREHWPYIRGIVLYGDPQFYDRDLNFSGLARMWLMEPLNPAPPYEGIADRWLTLCLDKDPVCGRGYPDGNGQLDDAKTCGANPSCEHKKYVERDLTREGGEFLASKAFQ